MNLLGTEPVKKGRYNVIVVGGGIAGIAAAVAASREKAKVLLIEKSINLGGLATNGLISWYEPLCDGKGRQMIHGIAEELIKLAVKYGFDNLPEKWGGTGKSLRQNDRYSTFFSPTIFSVALEQFVLENNVTLLFDSLATYPIMENNRCLGIVAESVDGRDYFEADAVVDATGNASVMHRAGVPTVVGRNYMTYVVHYFEKKMRSELSDTGNLCKFRKWMNTGSDMFGNGHPEEMDLFTGTSPEEITVHISVNRRADSADIGVTFPESSAYNSAQTACFY